MFGRFWLVAAMATLVAYTAVHSTLLVDAPIHSDGYSYYVYLPAWFLHDDPTLQSVADDCCGGVFPEFTSILRWPSTNRWINPHPIGVALMMAPFFFVAHLLTLWSNMPPDGFSLYYQHAAGLAGAAAFVVGLAILKSFLSRYFSERVTLAALATVALGTNLFHYAAYDSTFSHAFSFALVAALLDLTDRWWRDPAWSTSLLLSVVCALIFLTRHPNAVFFCIVPLWNPRGLWARRRLIAAMCAVAALCITPQLLVYKLATGHWLVSAYGQLGRFDFRAPRLAAVLFGVEKGLFFWSPVLLLAMAGFFVDHPLVRRIRLAAGIVFAVDAYLIASWSDWQFGASFGHRGFTDALPFAAVSLAAFYAWVGERPRLVRPVATAATLLVALSCAQMVQYWLGILPNANTTWTQYRELFLRFQ